MKTADAAESLSYVGLRYMTSFRCIGPDCEDSCCGEWAVTVDDARHEALRRTMGQTEQGRAEFCAAVEYRVEGGGRVVALLVQRPDRNCAFLGADKLCTVQQRYGEALLPDDCALYPRSVGQLRGRVELSGNLSCPEAARLCLLAPDSTDLVPIDSGLVPRGLAHYAYADSPQDVSVAALDDIRDLARHLLALRGRPLDERLFFLAVFLDSASLLVGPSAGPRAHVHFAALLQSMRRPETHEQLRDQLALASSAGSPALFAPTVVSRVLSAMQRRTAAVRALFGEVLGTRAAEPGSGVRRDADGTYTFSSPEFGAAARARRAELPEAYRAREDAIFERFSQNHLVRLWPIWSANLRSYGVGLFARLAVARYLLRNHPDLRGAEGDQTRLDALAVRVVYTTSRVLDHEGTILRGLSESLVESGQDTLANALSLLQF